MKKLLLRALLWLVEDKAESIIAYAISYAYTQLLSSDTKDDVNRSLNTVSDIIATLKTSLENNEMTVDEAKEIIKVTGIEPALEVLKMRISAEM